MNKINRIGGKELVMYAKKRKNKKQKTKKE